MAIRNVGDVVRLKSGGPFMTITDVVFGGGWVCHWFVDGVAQTYNFPDAALFSKAEAIAEQITDLDVIAARVV